MKDNLVKESISFERGKDPKKMLGIGVMPAKYKSQDFASGECEPVVDDYLINYKGVENWNELKNKGWTYWIHWQAEESKPPYIIGNTIYKKLKKDGLIKESYDEDEYENDLYLHEDPIYDEVYYALRDLGISDDVADDLIEKNGELIHEAEDQNFTIIEIAYMLKDRIK